MFFEVMETPLLGLCRDPGRYGLKGRLYLHAACTHTGSSTLYALVRHKKLLLLSQRASLVSDHIVNSSLNRILATWHRGLCNEHELVAPWLPLVPGQSGIHL